MLYTFFIFIFLIPIDILTIMVHIKENKKTNLFISLYVFFLTLPITLSFCFLDGFDLSSLVIPVFVASADLVLSYMVDRLYDINIKVCD